MTDLDVIEAWLRDDYPETTTEQITPRILDVRCAGILIAEFSSSDNTNVRCIWTNQKARANELVIPLSDPQSFNHMKRIMDEATARDMRIRICTKEMLDDPGQICLDVAQV